MQIKFILGCILLLLSVASAADVIPMRDFIQLKKGMSEGEILHRVGPFDYERVQSDKYHHIIRKTWFYLPAKQGARDWITEIVFDSRGFVHELNRYRSGSN